MRHRILFLHESGEVSGAENSLMELATRLDRKRFEPIFACPSPGQLADQLMTRGIMVYPVTFPKVRGIFGVLRTLTVIIKIIDERGIDLIHSNSIRTHIYGTVAGRMRGLKIIWHERNLIEKEIIDPERALEFLPDSIICNSRAVAMRFVQNGSLPRKVTIIHNGVDTDRFNSSVSSRAVRDEFGIKHDDIVVGIASRFNRNKGHETFLEAARIISDRRDFHSVKFLIVGGAVFAADKEREVFLKKLCAEKGIGERVIFTGVRTDMPAIYAAMDIMVLSSKKEACGRVILEAMASGKPVIGTDSGGTPEMITDGVTGLLFKPGDFCELADKIIRLTSGEDRPRLAMGKAARERADSEFSIKRNVAATEKLYEGLLSDRSH